MNIKRYSDLRRRMRIFSPVSVDELLENLDFCRRLREALLVSRRGPTIGKSLLAKPRLQPPEVGTNAVVIHEGVEREDRLGTSQSLLYRIEAAPGEEALPPRAVVGEVVERHVFAVGGIRDKFLDKILVDGVVVARGVVVVNERGVVLDPVVCVEIIQIHFAVVAESDTTDRQGCNELLGKVICGPHGLDEHRDIEVLPIMGPIGVYVR